jgi:hypothetical protein
MMKRQNTYALLATVALSACSGGSGGMVPVTNAIGNAPAVASPSPRTSGQTAKVSFLIDWPKPKKSVGRNSRFVSPSTMSAVLQVGTGSKTIVGIANNNGQPSATIEVNAPVGSDEFTVALYDQPQKAGKPPAGLELGQGEVVQKVDAGKVNQLHVVVDGLVASVNVAVAPSSTAVVTGDVGKQRLTLVGDTGATLIVTPLDADGNAIVAPGVVPSVDLQASYSSTNKLTVTRVSSNEFTVYASGPVTGAAGALVASAKGPQAVTQTNVAVIESSAIYVAYATGNGAKIAVYDGTGHPIPLASNAFSGVTEPVGLAYDADDRLLFVADKSGKLLAFDGAGNPSHAFQTQSVPGINSVNYFNAQIVPFPSYAIANPKRIIVGGSSGITEFDETTGAKLVQTSLPFTPTAVSGLIDEAGISTSGWLVMVGDPSGSVDPYDMATLAPYASSNMPMNGEIPSGFGAFLMPQSYGYAGDFCFTGKSLGVSPGADTACLYTVTGSSSNVVQLGNTQYLGPFGQYGVPGSFEQATKSGTLSAIAVDELDYYLDVTNSAANSITEYAVTDGYDLVQPTNVFKVSKKFTFTTPSSLGYSTPNAIAVEW